MAKIGGAVTKDPNTREPDANRAALMEIREELEVLPSSALLNVNVDVMRNVVQLRILLVQLRELMPGMVAALRAFDPGELDKLERYANALVAAQAAYASSAEAHSSLVALADEGIDLRGRLLAEIKVLKARHLLSEKAAANLRGGNAYRHIAKDLLQLAEFLRAQGTLPSETTVAVDRAEAVANQLIDGLSARRRQPTADAIAAALTRRQAFTLFSRSYVEVRRVVQFARFHEGDTDRLLPPLTNARKGRSRKRREADDVNESGNASLTPETREASPLKAASDAKPLPEPEPSRAASPPVGFPGSDPFIN